MVWFRSFVMVFVLASAGWFGVACEERVEVRQRVASLDAFRALEVARERVSFEVPDHALLVEGILHETNERRREVGLRRLELHSGAGRAACVHALDMLELGFFAHENPHVAERRSPLDRVQGAGVRVRYVAENLGQVFGLEYEAGVAVYPRRQDGVAVFSLEPGGEPLARRSYAVVARAMVDAWMGSEGHRRNVLSEHPTHLGVACVYAPDGDMPRFTCVQKFVRPH